MDSGVFKGMITIVELRAEDPNVGLALGELKVFVQQIEAQHVGREVTDVKITVRTGWRSQIRLIKAEIEHD